MLANGKTFFAGVGEAGKPGAIQIWKFPMEYVNEVQAHAGPIKRMRLSLNNDTLFTAGQDCCLMIHEIKDRDPRGAQVQRGTKDPLLQYSDLILSDRTFIEEKQQERDRQLTELAGSRDSSHTGVNEEASANDLEDKIKKLHEQLSSQKLMIRSKIDQLEVSKCEIEDQFEKQLSVQAEENH